MRPGRVTTAWRGSRCRCHCDVTGSCATNDSHARQTRVLFAASDADFSAVVEVLIHYRPGVITAAQESTQNLTGAFIMIMVMIGMSFLAGYGLCFMRMTKRKDG